MNGSWSNIQNIPVGFLIPEAPALTLLIPDFSVSLFLTGLTKQQDLMKGKGT